MYESSSISSGSPNLVNNVDEEISISNGVICQANQTLQNGHSDEIENTIKKDKNSPENSYQVSVLFLLLFSKNCIIFR